MALTKLKSSGIADGAVTASDIAANSVTVAQMSRAGTSGQVLTSAGTGADAAWAAAAAGGKVLQVVTETKTDTQSITGTTFTTVIDVDITPSNTSSRIIIFGNFNVSGSGTYSGRYIGFTTFRDSTQIALGDTAGSRFSLTVEGASNTEETYSEYMMFNNSFHFIDSPSSTSQITYAVKVGNTLSTATSDIAYINRSPDDSDTGYIPRGISTVTLMEIGA